MQRITSGLFTFGLALGILPWLAGPGGFETVKLLYIAAVLFLVSLSLWLSRRPVVCRQPITTGLIVGWLVYVSLRAALSPGPVTAWLGTFVNPIGVAGWWVIGGLAIGILNHSWSKKEVAWRDQAVVLAGCLLIITAVVQRQTGFGVNWLTFDDPNRGRYLFGSIGSPAQLGVVAALLSSLLINRLSWKWRSLVNWTWLGLVGLTIASQSTTGIGLLLISGLIAVTPRRWRKILAAGIGLGLTGVILLATFNQPAVSRWPSLAERGAIWHAGAEGLTDKPIWGWGPNHFQLAYDRHYPTERLEARSLSEERAHNLPLEILVETGLVGGLLAASTLGFLLYKKRVDSWLPLYVWIIASLFNPTIVPVMALGLLTLIESNEPADRAELGRATKVLPVVLLISCGLLLYVAAIETSTTLAADRAAQHSSDLEFSAAATVATRAWSRWPHQPQLALIAAEAQTNSALKTDLWIDSDVTASLVRYSTQESPFFLSALTRWKIGRYWLEAGSTQAAFSEAESDWQDWQSHPRARFLAN